MAQRRLSGREALFARPTVVCTEILLEKRNEYIDGRVLVSISTIQLLEGTFLGNSNQTFQPAQVLLLLYRLLQSLPGFVLVSLQVY